jgi:hypothetical protein
MDKKKLIFLITSVADFPTAIQIDYREGTEEKQKQKKDHVSRRFWRNIVEDIPDLLI